MTTSKKRKLAGLVALGTIGAIIANETTNNAGRSALINTNTLGGATTNPTPETTISTKSDFLKLIANDSDFANVLKTILNTNYSGSAGANGTNGIDGKDGVNGKDGTATQILTGSGDPTDTTGGNVNDLYLDSVSGDLFIKSNMTQTDFFASGLQGVANPNSVWLLKGNFKGSDGFSGVDGLDGIGFTFKGGHSMSPVFYDVNDVVTENNSLYVAKLANVNKKPSLNANEWKLMVQAPTNGTNGTNGQAGSIILPIDTLPNDANTATLRVGDYLLATPTGILYQKTDILPENFASSGIQGFFTTSYVFKTVCTLKGADGASTTTVATYTAMPTTLVTNVADVSLFNLSGGNGCDFATTFFPNMVIGKKYKFVNVSVANGTWVGLTISTTIQPVGLQFSYITIMPFSSTAALLSNQVKISVEIIKLTATTFVII